MGYQPCCSPRRDRRWRGRRGVIARLARSAVAGALLCLVPVDASAQRDAFIGAFAGFHSRLIGTFGDEGPQIAASLDEMAARLDEWERETAAAESKLQSLPASAPGDFAVLYLDSGRRADALRAIEAAIEAEPKRAAFHRLRALILEAVGRGAEAIAAYTRAWELDPDDPVSAYLLGDRRIADGDLDIAPQVAALLAAFERTQTGPDRRSAPFVRVALVADRAADTPIFSPVFYVRGLELMARGQYKEAVAQFRDAASRDPLVTDSALRSPAMMQGTAALRSGRVADAIAPLQAAVAASPRSAEAHRILGSALRATGDGLGSVKHLTTAVALAPDDERARVALGRALMDGGRLDEAEKALRETLVRLPESGEARWALADLYEKQGRGLDAISELDAATSLTVLAGKGQLYWRLADLLHRHQDYERVVIALGHRARLMPNEPVAHKDLGLAYARLGRPDHALLELTMSALIGIEDAETLAAIGQTHLDGRRYAEAELVLRRAVAMQPDLPQAQYALGTTLIRQGMTEEGRKHLAEFQRLRTSALERQQRTFKGEALSNQEDPVPEPEK